MPPKRRDRNDAADDPTQPKITDSLLITLRGRGGVFSDVSPRGGGGRGRGNGSKVSPFDADDSGGAAQRFRRNVPCQYFTGHPGSCRFGSKCEYKHDEQLVLEASMLTAAAEEANRTRGGVGFGMTARMNDGFDNLSSSSSSGAGLLQERQSSSVDDSFARRLLASVTASSGNNNNNNNNSGQGAVSSRATVLVPWDQSVSFHKAQMPEKRPLWPACRDVLQEQCASIGDFVDLLSQLHAKIDAVNSARGGRWGAAGNKNGNSVCPNLLEALRTMPGEPTFIETKFLPRILPKLQSYVLAAPLLFPRADCLPKLVRDWDGGVIPPAHNTVVLTQLQCTVLLAVGFFGLFPPPPPALQTAIDPPGCNLTPLFTERAGTFRESNVAKIQCLLGYFDTVTDDSIASEREQAALASAAAGAAAATSATTKQQFVVEFVRTSLQDKGDTWFAREAKVSAARLCAVEVDDAGVIESNTSRMLQADFANKSIGGGVLHSGCVQEEIRFVISPELLLSRLFVEELADWEVVHMSGSLMYVRYDGYGNGFRYSGRLWPLPEPSADEVRAGMRDVAVVAFDAINYKSRHDNPGMTPESQYDFGWVQRELIKAYAAFRPVPSSRCESARNGLRAVATGNWGCGVFAGDLELKFVIQLIAATLAGRRSMHYFTFGKMAFADGIQMFMEEHGADMTAGLLLAGVYSWCKHKEAAADRQRLKEEEQRERTENAAARRASSTGTIDWSDVDAESEKEAGGDDDDSDGAEALRLKSLLAYIDYAIKQRREEEALGDDESDESA